MSEKQKLFWNMTAQDFIKIIVISAGIIYGYSTLNAEVTNLKTLRLEDKKDFKELLVDLKTEVVALRMAIVELRVQSVDKDQISIKTNGSR